MKKFIGKIIIFSLFSFISYCLLLVLWHRIAPKKIGSNFIYEVAGYAHMYTRMKEVKQTQNVDILFLGPSHTYRGFDPRIFKEYGYKTFNMGSSDQTPLQTKLLLQRYLNRLNPKLIIYEITPKTFEDEGIESSLDFIPNDKIDFNSIKMALTINNIKTYNTLLYGIYLKLFSKNAVFKEDSVRRTDVYVSGGYVESKISHNDGEIVNYEKKKWEPLNYQINSFEYIIRMIKKKNIKLILVQSPIPAYEYDRYYLDNTSIDSYFLTKCSDYYNFNNFFKTDYKSDYFDRYHLNQNAVRGFNEYLIKKIIPNP